MQKEIKAYYYAGKVDNYLWKDWRVGTKLEPTLIE